jgi:hypothetical protein
MAGVPRAMAGRPIESSVFVGVEDLRGEGGDLVLDRIVNEFGATGITVAAAYHRARDLTPHGSPHVTIRHDGVHFVPDGDLFDGLRLQPPVQRGASEHPLRALRTATSERGVALSGWTVFCHNTTLGEAHPDCTTENAFGERGSPADLCPSHPDVRAYVLALARNVARLGVDEVLAESLHFGTFEHGYHHERSFVTLGGVDRFLLSLCFCTSCTDFAKQQGVDAEAARVACHRWLAAVLDGGEPSADDVTPETVAIHAGGVLADYATSRLQSVSELAAVVSEAVSEAGSRLAFLDGTGAVKGYAKGTPSGRLAAADAWQLGIDPAGLGRQMLAYSVLAYARDTARVQDDVAAYRAAVGDKPELRVVLRPCLPDTESAAHLTAKVAAVVAAGADAVDFYHYGLAPLNDLRRIPVALQAVRDNENLSGGHG